MSLPTAKLTRGPERRWAALADLSGDQGTVPVRRMLDRISRKQDGTVAAANTANRKRMVLGNAMDHACETGGLPSNPLKRVKWTNFCVTRRTMNPNRAALRTAVVVCLLVLTRYAGSGRALSALPTRPAARKRPGR
jgi:hypothetical protein